MARVAEFIALERLCLPVHPLRADIAAEKGPLWVRMKGRAGVKDFLSAGLAQELGRLHETVVMRRANSGCSHARQQFMYQRYVHGKRLRKHKLGLFAYPTLGIDNPLYLSRQ